MAVSVRSVVMRRGALVAGLASLSLGVAMLVQHAAHGIIWLNSLDALFALVLPLRILPISVGFFCALWILAPIAPELRLFHVIMRAALGVGIGSTLSFAAIAVLGLVRAVDFTGDLFANAFPTPVFNASSAVDGLAYALRSALGDFVGVLPLGILAGVIAWLWLARHPARHPVSGMIDEV